MLIFWNLIYLLCVNKKTNEIKLKSNCGILENIVQTYYGYHEWNLNGSLCMHILLSNASAPNPNEFVKKLRDYEQFQNGLLKYLDNIISQNILNCDQKNKKWMNIWIKKIFIQFCNDENVNLSNQWKGEDVVLTSSLIFIFLFHEG